MDKEKTISSLQISTLCSTLLCLHSLHFLVLFTSNCKTSNSLLHKTINSQISQCSRFQALAGGEKFFWYAPHSRFSNQQSEYKNGILMAGILHRTLIVPPILDHHAVPLGSCPNFRVQEIRVSVWNHAIELAGWWVLFLCSLYKGTSSFSCHGRNGSRREYEKWKIQNPCFMFYG